jgi:hypothetical protein
MKQSRYPGAEVLNSWTKAAQILHPRPAIALRAIGPASRDCAACGGAPGAVKYLRRLRWKNHRWAAEKAQRFRSPIRLIQLEHSHFIFL